IEKIQAITCSASAISSLTDNQIQDIIICFPISIDDSSVKCQKMIGVTNCNAHVTEKTLPETEVNSNSNGSEDDEDEFLDKTHSRFYNRYKNKTGLDPWINSETSESKQIENADNYLSQDYSEAKCPICKEVHTRLGIWGDWSCLGKNDHYFLNCPFRINQKKVIIAIQSLSKTQVRVSNKISNSPIHPNKTCLYQYAIKYKIDLKKFSVITEAEKNKWAMECFPADLKRNIRLYRGGIKRNEDTRKYHKFLTDRNRLVGEDILKSGLSTAWLDDLMKEWEEIHAQFNQILPEI
ncbi:9031_t:CDS:2, partial [Diversispora eburnea]